LTRSSLLFEILEWEIDLFWQNTGRLVEASVPETVGYAIEAQIDDSLAEHKTKRDPCQKGQ